MRRRNVAYIRVANKSDDAIELQKQLLDKYAEIKNFKIDYYYIDNGYSGINFDRPGMRQMLRDIKSRKITDKIIFKDTTRLSRNQRDLLKVINEASKRNIQLFSTINEEIMQINMMSVFAKFERDNNKDRVIKSQKFLEERQIVVSPYKLGTSEDLEYKQRKRDELTKRGVKHITFKNREQFKKESTNENR